MDLIAEALSGDAANGFVRARAANVDYTLSHRKARNPREDAVLNLAQGDQIIAQCL